jgi:hypothetical protein
VGEAITIVGLVVSMLMPLAVATSLGIPAKS